MAPKKLAITSKALQTLLTRIGSASSGTKSALLARFQRDVQRPGFFNGRGDGYGCGPDGGARSDKLRVVSIDMGIRNLAFCDAEVSRGAEAHMRVLRWEKLDLTHHHTPAGDEAAAAEAENEDEDEEADPFSPGVLARTAHRLVVEQVLSADPDVVLIEKQRWRSGGGSAVQQWTVRVNTLEAMLWAILETAKQQGGGGLPTSSRQHQSPGAGARAARTQGYSYSVRAVDPKRVGQYWLGRHARAVQEREGESAAADADARALFPANANPGGEEGDQSEKTTTTTTTTEKKKKKKKKKKQKQPTTPRSKAEKSAKIALLRSWLADATLSTSPSSPRDTAAMALSIAPAAEPTRLALLPKPKPKREPGPATKAKAKAARSEKKAEVEVPPLLLGEDMEMQMQRPRARTPKLDDLADCFLQAAAWVAWERERGRLLGAEQEGGVDEGRVLRMVECSQSRGEA
ncbi:hypothetical protein G6514_008273 [Epicoccum nigrum]|nr:hypothetical protein G6514_008273 [Epicoccum nigrum]